MGSPTDLPVDGRGGYLYRKAFDIPSYTKSPVNTTLEFIDEAKYFASSVCCTYGVCFGLCLMTLIHVLALTPAPKRRCPLWTFNVLGLLFEVARSLSEMWANTKGGTSSFYWIVTNDPTSHLTVGTKASAAVNQVSATLAFVAVQACLYIQAKAVMVNMKKRDSFIAMCYLLFLGLVAIIWRIVEVVWSCMALFNRSPPPSHWLQTTVLSLYSVSIGSWCLVFSIQVCIAIMNRSRIGIGVKKNEFLGVMLMTGVESMLIPSKSDMSRSSHFHFTN